MIDRFHGMLRRLVPLMLALALFAVAASGHEGEVTDGPRALTFDDLISLGRIGAFEVSPDGKTIAFTVTWFDRDKNSSKTEIYTVGSYGGDPAPFIAGDCNNTSPCWSPDGGRLAFVSDREGGSQIWIIPIGGGEAKKLTDLPTGASDPLWSPDGRRIAFTSSVYPDCEDMDCNAKKLAEAKESAVRARIADQLMYRHWNSWRDGTFSHLFLVDLEDSSLTEINRGATDVPPIALGGARDYAFSPDGKEICFSMNPDPVVAVSTNNDLYIYSIADGSTRRITADNPSNDNDPRYSPDGRYLAWRAQMRPGFEADRFSIMLHDRRKNETRNLTADFDFSAGAYGWAPDSRSLWFGAEDKGRHSIFRVTVDGKTPQKVITGSFDGDMRVSPDGKSIILARQSIKSPLDLYRAPVNGKDAVRLTDINTRVTANLEMNDVEEFWYDGAAGRKVHGMLVKPPFFEEGMKYPLIVLIHGGPQGSFGDDFHYRWNVQMFASPGYVVATFNFTGSTGYGQAFTDAISGDWGGAPYVDIMNGVDFVTANFPFIDGERIAAAGASYGGYMIDWIEGHSDRFSCLVSHAGVYNLESMYGATEELWFPEWEYKGTPWTNPEMYEKFSPHRFAASFKTPCLVIAGENDFRVPYTQSLEFFTALQRMNVPSKLVVFPDEDHFVRKPQNAEFWWNTLYEWFDAHLKD